MSHLTEKTLYLSKKPLRFVKIVDFLFFGQKHPKKSNNQNAEMDEGSPVPEEPGSGSATSASDESDQPISPRGRRKRRRKTYVYFVKVFEIFPGMDTDVLCKLAELDDIVPSKVRGLVPEASAVR